MSFYVATYCQARPDRVYQLLAAIRQNFVVSRATTPGRQAARVFQRLNEPTTLLSLGEWDSQAAFEAYRASPVFAAAILGIGQEPTIDYLKRLYLFERMNERAGVVACATIMVAAERETDIHDFLMGAAHREMIRLPGLVSRELYQRIRADEPRSCFLAVHSWRTLADLENFRAGNASHFEASLQGLGASVTRFTGEIAVEFSRITDSAYA